MEANSITVEVLMMLVDSVEAFEMGIMCANVKRIFPL